MIETDTSGTAIAGIISQLHGTELETGARWHPVAYYSKKLTATEQRYETHDSELFAIVEAFRQWSHYRRGTMSPINAIAVPSPSEVDPCLAC